MKIEALDYPKAKEYALRRLSTKSQSSFELRKKLKEKGASPEVVDTVIADCIRLGFLNDEQWLTDFIQAKIAKKLGPFAIVQKLYAKGVDPAVAKKAVQKLGSVDQQKESIEQLLATRYRRLSLKNPKEKAKIFQSLQRKGFSLDIIREYIEKDELF